MSKVCVLGVAYPGLENFLDAYLASLKHQSSGDFEILLANDGFEEIQHYLRKHSLEARTRVLEMNGSPASIRRKLTIYAQNTEADYFIFTDCDDVLDENRVEESRSLLERYDIVVNDLCVTDEELKIKFPHYLSNRMDDGEKFEMLDLVDSNFMGLTNTSCSRKVLQTSSAFTNFEVIAFDWLFWSIALFLNHTAVFTNKTSSKYRMYGGNLAGLPQKVGAESIDFGLRVKQLHYKALLENNISESVFRDKLYQMEEMICSENRTCVYEEITKKENRHYPFWWENVRHVALDKN